MIWVLCFQELIPLDVKLWAILIGIIAGTCGYWFTTFHMQPVLRYRSLRNQVLSDFIYYAQVVNAEGLNEYMQNLYRERVKSNRLLSAQLSAAILDLPFWYSNYLKFRGRSPEDAAKRLIGFSNTTEYEASHKLEEAIRKKLGLPNET